MNLALIIGVAFGIGLLLIATGVRPAPVPLERALAELHRRRPDPLGLAGPQARSTVTRLFGSTWATSTSGSRLTASVSSDLRITGMSSAEYLAQRAVFAV